NAVRFGAHCVHWGYSWGQVRAHGPAIHDLLQWISGVKGHKDANNAVLVRGWSSHTIRLFGNRAGERLMTAPAPLPSPTVAGTYSFQDEGGSPNYWSWTRGPRPSAPPRPPPRPRRASGRGPWRPPRRPRACSPCSAARATLPWPAGSPARP